MRTITIIRLGAIAFAGLLCGLAVFVIVTQHYKILRLELDNGQISEMVSKTGTLRYGTITAVGPSAGVITVQANEPFSANGLQQLVITIDDQTFIGKQYRIGADGVYTGLSDVTQGTAADLQTGIRVALLPQIVPGGGLRAAYVLFGNPL